MFDDRCQIVGGRGNSLKAFTVALISAVAVMLSVCPVFAQVPALEMNVSMLQRESELHRFDAWQLNPPVPWRRARPIVQLQDRLGTPEKPTVVFGYLPYWNVGDAVIHLDILSHIAYFGVELAADGSLGDSRHWGTSTLDTLIAQAHAEGVRVVLTVTNFSGTDQQALLSSSTARALAVSNLVDLVVAGGGDGVNIDFEGLPVAVKAEFVTFISDLKAAMDAALGDSSVTLATPAVDWKGSYDYDRLAQESDGLIIMGYDYYYSGGDPGPVSPLYSSAMWGQKSITWTLDDYDKYGGTANRDKFVLALPLYGYDWPADSDALPSVATASADAVSYSVCRTKGDAVGRNWDDDSAMPWYDYNISGAYHQVWCDTDESLGMKYRAAADRGIAGIGFWALGYESDYEEPWQEIVTVFGSNLVPQPDVVEVPDVAEEIVVVEVVEVVEDIVESGFDVVIGIDAYDAAEVMVMDIAVSDLADCQPGCGEVNVSSDLSIPFDSNLPADRGLIVDSGNLTDDGIGPESNSTSGCSVSGGHPANEDYDCTALLLVMCGLILWSLRHGHRVRRLAGKQRI